MSELANFWKKSKMSKKKFVKRKTMPPYILPNVIDDETQQNVFDSIASFLVQTLGDEFDKGYLDLDKAWQKANYAKIVTDADASGEYDEEYITELKLDADWIGEMRNQLLDDYPTPFCGRYAYLFSMETEDKEIKDDSGEVVSTKKGIKSFKPVNSKFNKDIRFFIYGRVAIFKNNDLGYDPKWDKSEGTTTEANGDETENTGEIQYVYCGVFASQDCAEKITEYVRFKLDNETPEKPFIVWDSFIIAGKIKVQKKKATDPATAPDFSYTINADDVVFTG